MYLSVIIPCYNEKENLQRGVLNEVGDYLKKQSYEWEVVVVNDESSDGSGDLVQEFCETNPGFKLISINHGGKLSAVWAGIRQAQGEVVLFTDMDQSAPISETEKLLPFFKEGYRVVIGSRGTGRKNFSLFRLLASTIFRTFRRLILLPNIIDTQAGFKALSKETALTIFPKLEAIKKSGGKTSGWTVGSWDVELLFIAQKHGYKIKEVPILWEDRDQSIAKAKERKQGKFVKESIDMLKQILRVRLNDIRGYYNA